MTLEELIDQPWQTVVEIDYCHGSPCFVARNPELGSCIGQGDTPEEALKSLSEARRDLLGVMLQFGDPIPEPAEWNRLASRKKVSSEYEFSVPKPVESNERILENLLVPA